MPMLQGKAYWAKIVGPPQPGYDKTKREWSFDVAIDEATAQQLAEFGCEHKIKNKGDDRGDFVQFKRPEFNRQGEPVTPYKVFDAHKKPWPDDVLIGNGSEIRVIYAVNEIEFGGKKHIKPSAIKIQVVNLVPYEGGEDFPDADGESWDD